MEREKESFSLVIGYVFLACIGVTAILFAVITLIPGLFYSRDLLWPLKFGTGDGGIKIHLGVIIGTWAISCIIPSYSIYRHFKKKNLLIEAETAGVATGLTTSVDGVIPTEVLYPFEGVVPTIDTVIGGEIPVGPGVVGGPVDLVTPKADVSKKELKVSSPKEKKKETHKEIEKKTFVIYQYYEQRMESNWICPKCDVYNSISSDSCKLCGTLKEIRA